MIISLSSDSESLHSDYEKRRNADWDSVFLNNSEVPPNYWEYWESFSNGWRVPIQFLQPVGLDSPRSFEELEPLLSLLDKSSEVDVPPTDWMHITWAHVGFLMAADIMWSQVETFYVNSSPRLRRVEPFDISLSGISVDSDGCIYVGVSDDGLFREARKQARNGVPKVYEVLRESADFATGQDLFVPRMVIGHLNGQGTRDALFENLSPWRETNFGRVSLTHLQIGRVPIMPHDHYASLDIVAQIEMRGEKYREGYHN